MRTRGWAAVALGSVLLTACGSGDRAPVTAPSTGPVARTTPAHPTTSALDPAHVVAAPGRFRAPLQTADMLIFRQRPLSASMVRRIRHVVGVTRVERFSLAQVSIDDHAINVAAVDPSTFRNYNPDREAQFQQEWDRVAGGEMALRPRFREQVPADGYVRMGTSATAPQLHVGVYAPQIPQVDAIVNDSWVKTLGMRRGNALLVSTGIHTPLSIRKPIQRIVGGKASVAADGRRRPARSRPRHRADGVPGRYGGRRGRVVQLLRARRRPHRSAAELGRLPHLHRDHADHRTDDLQHPDVPPAAGGAGRDRRRRPGRRDPPE